MGQDSAHYKQFEDLVFAQRFYIFKPAPVAQW